MRRRTNCARQTALERAETCAEGRELRWSKRAETCAEEQFARDKLASRQFHCMGYARDKLSGCIDKLSGQTERALQAAEEQTERAN